MTDLRNADLRLLTLDLLSECPREHTQLRAALRDRLGGNTEVSSALLSRLLHELEAAGSIRRDSGTTHLYSATARGTEETSDRAEEIAALTADPAAVNSATDDDTLRQWLTEARDALRQGLGQLPAHATFPSVTATPEPGELTQRIDAITQTFQRRLCAQAQATDARGTLTPELTAEIEASVQELQEHLLRRLRAE